MALTPQIYLDVGGRNFGGWQNVNIVRAVDEVCIGWGVMTTRSWPGKEGQWWIEPGDKVTVRVNDEIVCTGWIDHISPRYDARQHKIEISGRGIVSDLVDCSYVGPPWQWKNTDPAEVIRDLCKPFDIKVELAVGLGEPFDFTVQQGETSFEAIERITRLRQMLAYEKPDGTLLITRVSEDVCSTRLVQGSNIKEARGKIDDRDRFSHYIVKGQKNGKDSSPEQAAQSLGEITDPSVRRYRPKLLVQSANTNNTNALDRAKWEKQKRWGKGREAEIIVAGWLMPDGKTWPINTLCDVVDTWLGLDRRLAITRANIIADDGGTRTVLTLQPPEALLPDPPDVEKDQSQKAGTGAGQPDFWTQFRTERIQGEERRRQSNQ